MASAGEFGKQDKDAGVLEKISQNNTVRVKRHYISGGKGANYETGYNVDVILKKIRFRKTGEKHTKLVTVTMLRCWDERCLSFPEPASSG